MSSRRPSHSLESLEGRRLMHALIDVSVNFAPKRVPGVEGMITDVGTVYGDRGDGRTFGWQKDNTKNHRDRNLITDQSLDTLAMLQVNGGRKKWEMAVENGDYEVTVASGDARYVDSVNVVNVEGLNVVNTTPSKAHPFNIKTRAITVTDGKITVRPGAGAENAKINWIRIKAVENDDGEPAARNNVTWAAAATAPVGRVEPETAVVDGKLYAFSGYSDSTWQPTRRVDRFDPATNAWTKLNDMPLGLTHAGVAVVGKKVWFAGGYEERLGTEDQQNIAVTTVKIYDTETDTWADGPSLPAQRGSGGLALVANKLYFFTGEIRNRSNVADTWVLDLANQGAGWQSKAPIPDGRTHFGTAVIGTDVYIMGGQHGIDENSSFLASSYKYSTTTNTWTRLADLPIAMSHYSPSTVVFEDKIYLFGGEYQFNFESSQALEYTPATNTYRTLAPLPVERAAAMAGVIDGKFIFSGGKKGGWHGETYIGTWS